MERFLEIFLRTAKRITKAERGFAVDRDLNALWYANIDAETVDDPAFSGLAFQTLQQALETGDAIVTNNMVADPAQAPQTNTNFANLMVVVALPVGKYGAVYLDQHIRNGIIAKHTTDRLVRLANQALDKGQVDISEDELVALFEHIP
jgi:hypothetical protein